MQAWAKTYVRLESGQDLVVRHGARMRRDIADWIDEREHEAYILEQYARPREEDKWR